LLELSACDDGANIHERRASDDTIIVFREFRRLHEGHAPAVGAAVEISASDGPPVVATHQLLASRSDLMGGSEIIVRDLRLIGCTERGERPPRVGGARAVTRVCDCGGIAEAERFEEVSRIDRRTERTGKAAHTQKEELAVPSRGQPDLEPGGPIGRNETSRPKCTEYIAKLWIRPRRRYIHRRRYGDIGNIERRERADITIRQRRLGGCRHQP